MANSEDPDEMPQDAAFHQVLQCLQEQNSSSEKEIYGAQWLCGRVFDSRPMGRRFGLKEVHVNKPRHEKSCVRGRRPGNVKQVCSTFSCVQAKNA